MNLDPNKSPAPQEPEPTTGSAPAPVWLFVLVALLAFWGMGFLDSHGGGFDARVYAPYNSAKELEDEWPKSGSGAAFARGELVYREVAKCILCHQPTGLGSPGQQYPPLAKSEWVLAQEPGRVIRIVLNGLQGPLTVTGQQFNSNGMVPWRDTLTDQQIADVLTYVRSEWGNNAPEVKPEQVKAIRDKTAGRSGQWLADELLKVLETE